MFKVVAEPRKRRVCPPRAIAASAVFHLLLLAGIAAALSAPRPELLSERGFFEFPPPPPPKPPERFPEQPTARPEPGHPPLAQAPVAQPDAQTFEIEPAQAPAPSDLDLMPAMPNRYSDAGPIGTAIGTPDHGAPPAHAVEASGGHEYPRDDDVLDGDDIGLETRPELSDPRGARQILQRSYPPLLRDIGATGRTVVQLIIGRDGRVEPGSARVLESTDRAFNDAAIRAVEQFRFRPATVRGRRVAVLVTIPIEWRVEN